MNNSGYVPVEYKVLILPKEFSEKTEGGIYIAPSSAEKEKFANTEGVIISVGSLAFTEPDWPVKPKSGDKVLFDKYAGSLVKGKDGEEYRLINDREIVAIEEE